MMIITIQEKTDTYLRFQAKESRVQSDIHYERYPGREDAHTLFNLLKEMVLRQDGVAMCGYARDSTFTESIVFQIQTEEGTEPINVLFDAVRELKDINDQFRSAFEVAYEID